MRLISGSLVDLQPLIEVSVAAYDRLDERVTVTALIDTGATRTCLTDELIRRLELPPRMKMLVAGATGFPERRRAYAYSLGLFCQEEASGLRTLYVIDHEFVAPSFQDNGGFQVLLGMDILSKGHLQIRPDQHFTFEFGF